MPAVAVLHCRLEVSVSGQFAPVRLCTFWEQKCKGGSLCFYFGRRSMATGRCLISQIMAEGGRTKAVQSGTLINDPAVQYFGALAFSP